MKLQVRLHVLATAALVILVLALRATPAQAADSDGASYTIGDTGGLVGFTISGRALLPIKREGRFRDFAGEVAYDPARPRDARVDLTVYTGSVDMHNHDEDQLLKSSDFFDVDHFPTMHFAGTVSGVSADGSMTVAGDLTIRGITKSIAAPVTFRASEGGPAARFETTFQIDRTEFGLNGAAKWGGFNVSIAKTVQIHIAVVGLANAPPMTK